MPSIRCSDASVLGSRKLCGTLVTRCRKVASRTADTTEQTGKRPRRLRTSARTSADCIILAGYSLHKVTGRQDELLL